MQDVRAAAATSDRAGAARVEPPHVVQSVPARRLRPRRRQPSSVLGDRRAADPAGSRRGLSEHRDVLITRATNSTGGRSNESAMGPPDDRRRSRPVPHRSPLVAVVREPAVGADDEGDQFELPLAAARRGDRRKRTSTTPPSSPPRGPRTG